MPSQERNNLGELRKKMRARLFLLTVLLAGCAPFNLQQWCASRGIHGERECVQYRGQVERNSAAMMMMGAQLMSVPGYQYHTPLTCYNYGGYTQCQ